ncbi:MAG: recombination protein RecR [Bacteroidia bacterium]|nr:MAG: recombination protein RecR [Bacteroidia bacterium]
MEERIIEKLIDLLSELSGIGKKTALRLVLEIIRKDEMYAYQLAQSLIDAKQKLKKCSVCGNIDDNNICNICANSGRNHQIICVVEDYSDVLAIENTNTYNGVYHVLGGLISPINGIGPSQLNIESLIIRLKEHPVDEVILALNATPDGESTGFYLTKKIRLVSDIKITTLAKGISVGEDLNYADELTLSRSIENRVPVNI